ncbi:MAG: transporter [Gammaproteobacteria bacterium]|jgi:EmrB/QacA subfamily drug resistance transporter|nr:transporter [Gammaproteobacteria bacterium]
MKKYIPFVIAFGLFMTSLDTTIMTTAIPQIASNLEVDPISLKAALTSYLLSVSIFIPISGWIADRFGTKNVFIAALFVFTLGSLLCGLANNLWILVLSRVIQGIGGALMMPMSRLILLKTFPKAEMVRVMGYTNMVSLIGPVLGPVLGGVIVSYVSWRWIFMVNVPFGIAGIIFSLIVLKNHVAAKVNQLDFPGFILFGIGLASFVFAFQSIGESNLNKDILIGIISVSFFAFLIYFIRSHYIQHPFLDFTVFKIRTFRITVLGSFLSRSAIGGMPFVLPLFFQLGLGKTAMSSGFLLLPYAMGMLIMKTGVNQSLKWFGFKHLLIANTFLLGISIISFILIDAEIPLYGVIIILFIHGLFTSMQFSCMNALVYADLTDENLSAGTSIASAAQQISMSFGIAISAIILQYLLGIDKHGFDIEVHVFHQTFVVLGVLTILASFAFLLLNKKDGSEMSKHTE